MASLTVLPNGDLVAGGLLTASGSVPLGNLARWDGVAWSAFAGGTSGATAASSWVYGLATTGGGELVVAGSFSFAGGVPRMSIARLASNCPAHVQPAGVGCASASSSPTLGSTVLPWVGASWRGRATGLPGSASVAAVVGLANASLPLAAVLPQAVAGCVLHVAPDAISLGMATNGGFDQTLAIPNLPALAGLDLFTQLVALELGPQLQFLSITASNALRLTIGVF